MSALSLLCLLLLFVGGPGPYSLRTFTFAWGLGHLLSFALWGYLYLLWRGAGSFRRLAGEVLLLSLLLGGLTELLQAGFGREASWVDLGNDLLGAGTALVFSRQRFDWQPLSRLLLQTAVVLLIGWQLIPFAKVVADDVLAQQQFPLLSGFETRLEVSRWGGACRRQIDVSQAYSGARSLRVDLGTQRYAGLALKHFPADWSGYSRLRFHLYNPANEPFQFYFRIHDQQHKASDNRYSDRFNTEFTVPQGWNSLEIDLQEVAAAPKDRQLDLAKVAGMNIFVGKLAEPFSFYLDEVILLP
ncbi:hypothetical protein [Malonomonas rubra]|uniref:hypothetical protein n=1 Tax=Malonomonas rubra TaxID=57040 RepID=UPI001114F925|nr:hypothetical protein [Malonomonas rubra]